MLDFLKTGGKAPTALILVAAWTAALTTFVCSAFGFASFDAAGAALLTGASSALYYGRRRSDG